MLEPGTALSRFRNRSRRRIEARPDVLHLGAAEVGILFRELGPSLGLWRAAEVAALREVPFERPVLDLGCGDGLVSSLVLKRIEVGLDPDGAALEKAARRGIYGRLVERPAEDAGIPPRTVGTVIGNSVLEHIPWIEEVLAAVGRMLWPGGHLVLTAPTEAFSGWLAVPARRYADWRNRGYDHRNLWTLQRWAHALGRAGLRIERVRPYLRRRLVTAWDLLEVLQKPRIAGLRPFGALWRRLPSSLVAALARRAAAIDLAAPPPGGGRLIVARKR